MVQGDTPFNWRTDEFRMFEDGSMWRPPQMNPYSQGMPDELVEGGGGHSAGDHGKKAVLTDGYVSTVSVRGIVMANYFQLADEIRVY